VNLEGGKEEADAMDWQEAKQNTLQVWSAILASLGRQDEVGLLTEINAITDLCEMAKEVAHGDLKTCLYCPAYQQFGGCREVSAKLSELVVDKDWAELRRMVQQVIGQLEGMRLPPERPRQAC
jgi:hypothetical protein